MRKATLACVASVTAVLAAGLHGQQMQGQKPKPGMAQKMPSAPVAAPIKYRVKILFVRLADDDGSKPSTLTKDDALAAISAANAIFRRNLGNIAFEMAQEADFAGYVRNTAMNHDCLLQSGWNETTIAGQTTQDVNGDGVANGADVKAICDSTPVVAARNTYAMARPNRLVVYSRGSSEYVKWEDGHYVLKYASGGHSGVNLLYVAMPASFGGSTLLAHETGHYFHLPHTFGAASYVPATMADAYSKISAWMTAHPGDSPLGCFEGDRRDVPAIQDTPEDASIKIFSEVHGGPCIADKGTVPFVVTTGGVQQTLTLAPDRANIMSYFKNCPWPMQFSRNQYRIMDDSLATGNRQPLTVGDPYQSPCYGSLQPEGDLRKDPMGSLQATVRKLANCLLLARKPWPWEVVTDIYSRPERATRTMVADKAIAGLHVDLAREAALLGRLSDGRSIVYEDER